MLCSACYLCTCSNDAKRNSCVMNYYNLSPKLYLAIQRSFLQVWKEYSVYPLNIHHIGNVNNKCTHMFHGNVLSCPFIWCDGTLKIMAVRACKKPREDYDVPLVNKPFEASKFEQIILRFLCHSKHTISVLWRAMKKKWLLSILRIIGMWTKCRVFLILKQMCCRSYITVYNYSASKDWTPSHKDIFGGGG
jgi:hypothetical protein